MASMARTHETGLGIYWTDPKAPICRSVYGETIMKSLSPADRRALGAGGPEETKSGIDVGDGSLYRISCMLGEASQISSSSEQSLSSPLGTACSHVASISSCMSSCEIQTPVDRLESSPQLYPLLEVLRQSTQLTESTSPPSNTVEESSPQNLRKSLPAHWIQEATPSSPSSDRPVVDGSRGTTADDGGSKDHTPKRKGYAPTLKTAQRAAARETKKKDSPVEPSPIHDVWTMWGKSVPAKAAKKAASPVTVSSVRGQTPSKTSSNGQQSPRSPSKASISPTKTLRARPKQSQDGPLSEMVLPKAEMIDSATASPTDSSYASAHSHHGSESSSNLSPDLQTSVYSFVTAKEEVEEVQGDALKVTIESTSKSVRFVGPRSGNGALKATRSIGDLRGAGTIRSGSLRDPKAAAKPKPKLSVLIPQLHASSLGGAPLSSGSAESPDSASPSSPSRIPKLALKTRKPDLPSTSSLKKSTAAKYQLPKRKECLGERACPKDAETPLILSATTDSSIDDAGTCSEIIPPQANHNEHEILTAAERSAIDAFLSDAGKPVAKDSEGVQELEDQQIPNHTPEGCLQADKGSQVLADEADNMMPGQSASQDTTDLLDRADGPHAAGVDAHSGSSVLLEPQVEKTDAQLGEQELAARSVVDALGDIQAQPTVEQTPRSGAVDDQAGLQLTDLAIAPFYGHRLPPAADERNEPALNDPAIIYSGSKAGGHRRDSVVVSNSPAVTPKYLSDVDPAIVYSGPRLGSEATPQAVLEEFPRTDGSLPVLASPMITTEGLAKSSQLRATAEPFIPTQGLPSIGASVVPYSPAMPGSPSSRTSPRKKKNKKNGRFSPTKPHFATLGAPALPVFPVAMPTQARFDPMEHRHWETVSAHSPRMEVLAMKPNCGYWQTVKESVYPNNSPYDGHRPGYSQFIAEGSFSAMSTSSWRKLPPPPYRMYDNQILPRQVPWDTGRPRYRDSGCFDSFVPAADPKKESEEKPAPKESSDGDSNGNGTENGIEKARPEYLGYTTKVTPCGKYNVESAVEWINQACHECRPDH